MKGLGMRRQKDVARVLRERRKLQHEKLTLKKEAGKPSRKGL